MPLIRSVKVHTVINTDIITRQGYLQAHRASDFYFALGWWLVMLPSWLFLCSADISDLSESRELSDFRLSSPVVLNTKRKNVNFETNKRLLCMGVVG